MEDPTAPLRRSIYLLLIVAACGTMIGRIWSVSSEMGKSPTLCANDRSRWSTVRALVDHGTYVLDDVIFLDEKQTKRDREWYSIDMVRHKGHDGREHYYSSKPPLLATLIAGKYWLLKQCAGVTMAEHPFYAIRVLLITTNVIAMLIYFCLLASMVERYGSTDWGRLFVMTGAVFGTFLTTFAVTLNNHSVAAASLAIAVWAALPIWRDGERRWPFFAVAGFFAAFIAANELPGLAFLGLLGLMLFWRAPLRTLLIFTPATLVVAAAFFGTNYIAHGTWIPPYAHRHNGPLVTSATGISTEQFADGRLPDSLREKLIEEDIELSPEATVAPRMAGDGWVLWDEATQTRLALVGEDSTVRVYQWDDWYEYDRTYWVSEQKAGVDHGEASRLTYAMHILVGHHGVFSLTPIWLLSAIGIGWWLLRAEPRMRGFAALVLIFTVVLLAFYIRRPLVDRNYGGVSCGFRWMFVCIPLWLICMLPVCDAIARRRTWQVVVMLLLLISVISASYATLNPWQHPWLYQYWMYLEWIVP